MYNLILRDILHYNAEELKNLSMIEYQLSLQYALETYVRRDMFFIISNLFKQKNTTGDFGFTIEHPKIEEWIKNQYEME